MSKQQAIPSIETIPTRIMSLGRRTMGPLERRLETIQEEEVHHGSNNNQRKLPLVSTGGFEAKKNNMMVDLSKRSSSMAAR